MSRRTRVAFFAASRFGAECVRRTLALPGFVGAGVVTAPRRFEISYRPEGVDNVLHEDFAPVAAELGLSIHELRTSMRDPGLTELLRGWSPDLILVAGWYHMVPRAMREIAPTLGLHASLLPDYRGGAPLVWAIINGETRTGITLFRLADGVDDGPVVGQRAVDIRLEDTIATLYARVTAAGLGLLAEFLPRIAEGTAPFIPQDLSQGRVLPQRYPEDGEIDWRWSAGRVYDFVRAQTRPYPGAFTFFGGHKVTLWSCAQTSALSAGSSSLPPGSVREGREATLEVTCGDGRSIRVLEAEWGGRAPTARDLAATAPVRLGRETRRVET